MRFRRGSNYHYVSECGEYSVAKVVVNTEIQYEAWHLPKDQNGRQIAIGVRQTSALNAQQLCRKHHENRGAKAA